MERTEHDDGVMENETFRAFADVVRYCTDNAELLSEFNRLTGHALFKARTPIEIVIDEACKHDPDAVRLGLHFCPAVQRMEVKEVLRGIKSVSEFTKKTPMYAIYLNVDSYAHNGNYYVWAEEITVQDVRFQSVIVTGRKSNPTMSVNEGTIVVLTMRNPMGFRMSEDEIMAKVNDAVRAYARHLEIFAERNGGLANA